MTIAEAKSILDLVAGLVALIGIPISVVRYFISEARKARREQAALYVEVNNKYLDFLNLTLKHPTLGISDRPENLKLVSLAEEDAIKQWALFSYLTSLMERAFYLTHSSKSRDKGEWQSWERYIADYLRNENYRQYWREVTGNFSKATSFGTKFENYMRDKYDPNTPRLSAWRA
jgi:hypothetical protein